MSKIELAKIAYDFQGSDYRKSVSFVQYFRFMWRNESKERLVSYIEYLRNK